MASIRFSPRISQTILRIVAGLLLVQGLIAWGVLLGMVVDGTDFDTLGSAARNFLLLQATLCPVAALGAWFLSDWGAVLWAAVAISLGLALAAGIPNNPIIGPLFATHLAAFAAWAFTSARVERRSEDRGRVGFD